MKLSTFDLPDGQRHIGALLDGESRLVDFTASSDAPVFTSMLALIDGGPSALDAARRIIDQPKVVHALSAVRLAAPLPEPRQMRDFMCFEKHVRQASANFHLVDNSGAYAERDPAKIKIAPIWYEEPIYYKCNRFSVVGPNADVIKPAYCDMLDFELEFAAILGTGGKNIAREQARSHIFGWCIFNDISARDQQAREMRGGLGPTKGKDFDTGNVLGPWLVTADEVVDPYGLTMIARVNGEEWSRGHSGEAHHRFEDVIAHVSRDETVHAGELFGSGTVGGGCGLELGRFLKDGDLIELEVEGLGTLANRIVFPQAN